MAITVVSSNMAGWEIPSKPVVQTSVATSKQPAITGGRNATPHSYGHLL